MAVVRGTVPSNAVAAGLRAGRTFRGLVIGP